MDRYMVIIAIALGLLAGPAVARGGGGRSGGGHGGGRGGHAFHGGGRGFHGSSHGARRSVSHGYRGHHQLRHHGNRNWNQGGYYSGWGYWGWNPYYFGWGFWPTMYPMVDWEYDGGDYYIDESINVEEPEYYPRRSITIERN